MNLTPRYLWNGNILLFDTVTKKHSVTSNPPISVDLTSVTLKDGAKLSSDSPSIIPPPNKTTIKIMPYILKDLDKGLDSLSETSPIEFLYEDGELFRLNIDSTGVSKLTNVVVQTPANKAEEESFTTINDPTFLLWKERSIVWPEGTKLEYQSGTIKFPDGRVMMPFKRDGENIVFVDGSILRPDKTLVSSQGEVEETVVITDLYPDGSFRVITALEACKQDLKALKKSLKEAEDRYHVLVAEPPPPTLPRAMTVVAVKTLSAITGMSITTKKTELWPFEMHWYMPVALAVVLLLFIIWSQRLKR